MCTLRSACFGLRTEGLPEVAAHPLLPCVKMEHLRPAMCRGSLLFWAPSLSKMHVLQAREDEEQAAERQLLHDKALQLLKHAVYLHKAKLAPPVPGGQPICDAGGRPVDFGDLVIR